MVNKLIKDLKALFHTFIYYKEDDEDNYHNWINDNVKYVNGDFVNYSSCDQSVSVDFSAWVIAPYYRRGNLDITVSEAVAGQTVQVDFVKSNYGTVTTVYLTTDSKGFCSLTDAFYRNYDATITVKPITVNGVEYTGASTKYSL